MSYHDLDLPFSRCFSLEACIARIRVLRCEVSIWRQTLTFPSLSFLGLASPYMAIGYLRKQRSSIFVCCHDQRHLQSKPVVMTFFLFGLPGLGLGVVSLAQRSQSN